MVEEQNKFNIWKWITRKIAPDLYEEKKEAVARIERQESGNKTEMLALAKIQCKTMASFNHSSGLYARMLTILTVVLVVFTLVLVALTIALLIN